MKLTLRLKTIIVFLLALSIAMAVLLISVYIITVDQQRREYIRYNTTILELEAESIEFNLNQVLQSSLSFYRSDNLMGILRGRGMQYDGSAEIRGELFSILNSNPYITQVHLYSSVLEMDYVVRSSSTAQGNPRSSVPEKEIPYNMVAITEQKEPDYGFSFNTEPAASVITLSRSIYDFPGRKYLGQIDIDMNLSHFQKMAETLSEHEILAFISDEGEMLFCSGDADVIEMLIPFMESGIIKEGADTALSEKYTAISAPVMPNGFLLGHRLIQAIPNEAITENARELARQNLLIGFIVSITALLILTRILTGYTKPFGYIENSLKKVSEGNLNVRMDIRDNTEFSGLAKQFNEMIDSINNLIIHGYKLEISNKNNQLKALQAQMDPHFINNALQNIGAEALKKGNLELYYSIMQFGEMMRYTMDFQSLMVTLEEELKYTTNYLNLQTMRFKGKFTYSISAADETMNILVPKLLLQPLVENIFKHGQIMDRSEKIHIQVSAVLADNTLKLECSNDGKGLSETELKQLRELIIKARNTEEESSHIGLINLSRRLFLVYGERSHIDIHSEENGGFKVMITITEILK